jgi:hypothetical protein
MNRPEVVKRIAQKSLNKSPRSRSSLDFKKDFSFNGFFKFNGKNHSRNGCCE